MAKWNVTYALKSQVEADTAEQAQELAQNNLEFGEFGDYSVDECTAIVQPAASEASAERAAA